MIAASTLKTACILAAIVLSAPMSAWAGTIGHHDIHNHPKCDYCGMDRSTFAHARVLVVYSDHTEEGYCSLHCAALMMAFKMRKAPLDVKVSDYPSLDLIPAHKATWVVGGRQRGVMTHNAKWAFKSRNGARGFISKYGGRLVDYTVALQTAFTDLYGDMQMFWPVRFRQAILGMNRKHGHH